MIERLGVESAQVFRGSVCVRERLKIDDELTGMKPLADVLDSLQDLGTNRIGLDRRRRAERVVVAVRTPTHGDRAVAIRTGKPRINDDLIDALAKAFFEPLVVAAESVHCRDSDRRVILL